MLRNALIHAARNEHTQGLGIRIAQLLLLFIRFLHPSPSLCRGHKETVLGFSELVVPGFARQFLVCELFGGAYILAFPFARIQKDMAI